MATQDFNSMDIFLQLEQDFLRTAEGALRAMRFQLRTDMYETDDALIIKMEIAGARPDRLHITLSADDRTLTVSGERLEPEAERVERIRCYHLEIFYGAFERTIALPSHLRLDRDGIKATCREGFLKISLPKRAENAPGTRTIPVTTE